MTRRVRRGEDRLTIREHLSKAKQLCISYLDIVDYFNQMKLIDFNQNNQFSR